MWIRGFWGSRVCGVGRWWECEANVHVKEIKLKVVSVVIEALDTENE
jgi:hypothetical protein